jgi:outer membrane immunogenic protein
MPGASAPHRRHLSAAVRSTARQKPLLRCNTRDVPRISVFFQATPPAATVVQVLGKATAAGGASSDKIKQEAYSMRTLTLAAALAAALVAVPAVAQDTQTTTDTSAPTADAAPGEPAAPDGSKAFGIEPYFGVLGGWEGFDRNPGHGIPATSINTGGRKLQGALVEGVIGANVPLGPVFIGAEGNVAKGVDGAIDWEYGAAGRFGLRAGDSGLFYGKVGYKWVNFDRFGNNSRDFGGVQYGIGFEAGPKDIGLKGITGNAGVRIRGEVSTYGKGDSFKPMLGLVTHF